MKIERAQRDVTVRFRGYQRTDKMHMLVNALDTEGRWRYVYAKRIVTLSPTMELIYWKAPGGQLFAVLISTEMFRARALPNTIWRAIGAYNNAIICSINRRVCIVLRLSRSSHEIRRLKIKAIICRDPGDLKASELIGALETARYFRQGAYDCAWKRDILSKGRQHWAASYADANWLLSRDRNGGTKLFNGSAVLTESGRSLNSRGIYISHVLLAKSGNINGIPRAHEWERKRDDVQRFDWYSNSQYWAQKISGYLVLFRLPLRINRARRGFFRK